MINFSSQMCFLRIFYLYKHSYGIVWHSLKLFLQAVTVLNYSLQLIKLSYKLKEVLGKQKG